MNKVVAIHLYNDYSGSPKVLQQWLNQLTAQYPVTVDLYTSASPGFLSGLANTTGITFFNQPYQLLRNRWLRLFYLFFHQFNLFIRLLKYRNEPVVFYVNTMLPFGAILAGKICGKKVVVHVHETSVKPALLKKFYRAVIGCCASEIIYVSRYLQQKELFPSIPSRVVYNALSDSFSRQAFRFLSGKEAGSKRQPFTVLMLCSLKPYKGVYEFTELARAAGNIRFILVLNADQEAINEFYRVPPPVNLEVYDRQSDVHPFYQQAHLVMNLSRPDEWVETFGLTALEAMSYGLPVIVPPVGGIAEIVEDYVTGFRISCYQQQEIIMRIHELMHDHQVYHRMSKAALKESQCFQPEASARKVYETLFSGAANELAEQGVTLNIPS